MATTKLRLFSEGEVIAGTSYRVRRLIGRGGMGSVYEVEHKELGRVFVLKALHDHLSSREDLVGRMRNEWRALAKLSHPNIVQVTDAGTTEEGLPYFIMEYLQGQALSDLLRAEGRLGLRHSCLILGDVLNGLAAAHATGAIHRDIKPPNIFITQEGRAKLLDFGIAKLRDRAAKVVTAGGVSIGTPRYMAPEQAEGGKVDGRADIYAAALVLYECLLGKGPFAHVRDPNGLVMAHLTEEPVRADMVDSMIPVELGDLLHRWLSKSPRSRPPSAEHAARELSALAETLPEDQRGGETGELTLGASYDAPTLGGPMSAPRSIQGIPPISSQASVAPAESPPSHGTNGVEAVRTQTFAPWSPSRGGPPESLEREDSLVSSRALTAFDDSALPVAGDMPRRLAAPEAGVPVVGLLLAFAAVSLLVAWGVMQYGSSASIDAPSAQDAGGRQPSQPGNASSQVPTPPVVLNRNSTLAGRSVPEEPPASLMRKDELEAWKARNQDSPRPTFRPRTGRRDVEQSEVWDNPPTEAFPSNAPAQPETPAPGPAPASSRGASAELPGSGL